MSQTAGGLIDQARIRHWAFTERDAGDGAALLFLQQRQKLHLARHGADIEGLVNTTLRYVLTLTNGALVAVVSGVPVYTTTYQDGWAVHVTGGGVPYIDTSEAPIAGDPFGQYGGTPGFPLPADFVRIVTVSLELFNPSGLLTPCAVIDEQDRLLALPGRNPSVFVSGNRLVPAMSYADAASNSADRWFQASALNLSYVALPSLTALTDTVRVPDLLCEALVCDLAVYFAAQNPKVTPAERAGFAESARMADSAFAAAALDMLGTPMSETVQYRG